MSVVKERNRVPVRRAAAFSVHILTASGGAVAVLALYAAIERNFTSMFAWLGLAIAVTCMIGHVFLNAASKKQQHELEAFSMKLENLLAESAQGAKA